MAYARHINDKFPIGLTAGTNISVKVIPRVQSESGFAVNLSNGKVKGCNIAFHFNPRLKSGTVVRNSFFGNKWLNEETDTPFMPFQDGTESEITIHVKRTKYIVFVDGKRFVEFVHRLPMNMVNYVILTGDAAFSDLKHSKE